MRRLNLARRPSPVGDLAIVWEGEVLRALDFGDYDDRRAELLRRHYGEVELVEADPPAWITGPLDAYFAGDLDALDVIPTATEGTAFQKRVWAALREIPAGETWTYGRLAAHIGKPAASRAVGAANGANPVAIAVPCHRVIAANGTLWGYGGGLDRKRALLEHEGAAFKPPAEQTALL